MQSLDPNSDEDELIRLLLKRQSELNSLLEVTRAINKNTATPVLVQMLEVILQNYLQVGSFRFLIEKDKYYTTLSKYGGIPETNDVLNRLSGKLHKFKAPTSLKGNPDKILQKYDYIIPIHHKNRPLAYAIIGEFNTSPEMVNNDLNFIQTLVNIIVVALENKKLFRERLETERFKREMELAVEVQNMLIPLGLHQETSVDIGAKYLPHQNIGGDYFDFIRLNEDEFLWCIADVSGKGMSAALLMANFQASLHAWATVEDNLTNIIKRLNHKVIENTKGEKFITLFLAKYNEKTRKLNYINAGHNPTVLYSDGEASQLKLGTTMIGAFEELPFINEGEVTIGKDSLVFNYTDGLIDFEPSGAKEWNENLLLDFVSDHNTMAPDSFNQCLMDHLNLIVKGKPIDDITLLTLRIF